MRTEIKEEIRPSKTLQLRDLKVYQMGWVSKNDEKILVMRVPTPSVKDFIVIDMSNLNDLNYWDGPNTLSVTPLTEPVTVTFYPD